VRQVSEYLFRVTAVQKGRTRVVFWPVEGGKIEYQIVVSPREEREVQVGKQLEIQGDDPVSELVHVPLDGLPIGEEGKARAILEAPADSRFSPKTAMELSEDTGASSPSTRSIAPRPTPSRGRS